MGGWCERVNKRPKRGSRDLNGERRGRPRSRSTMTSLTRPPSTTASTTPIFIAVGATIGAIKACGSSPSLSIEDSATTRRTILHSKLVISAQTANHSTVTRSLQTYLGTRRPHVKFWFQRNSVLSLDQAVVKVADQGSLFRPVRLAYKTPSLTLLHGPHHHHPL